MYVALIAFCLLLLVGCSGAPFGTEAPAPFLDIPIAWDAPRHEVSQGWFYSPGEIVFHPDTETHFAVDFPEPWGTPVYATAKGVAVASYHTHDKVYPGRTIGFGLGLFIAIWHEGAGVYTSYSHLSGINNELITYIQPTLEKGDWQPRNAIYMPVEEFKKIARPVKKGDLIGYVGYTGLRCGYVETPANPPTVDPTKDHTWDPAGAHLHWEVYTRTPDGLTKDKRYDPFGLYAEREAYGEVFKKAMGLILAEPDGSP